MPPHVETDEVANSSCVRLRLASRHDHRALVRLAQLDSRRLPPGPHLVGEREGRIDAALSLSDGEVVADPFRHTADLCQMLRLYARAIGPVRDDGPLGDRRRPMERPRRTRLATT